MDTALTLVIALLILLLVLCLMFYVVTQQDLRAIHQRLSAMDTPAAKPVSQRTAEVVRRERSEAHDKLVLIEASLSTQPREQLSADELATYESSRRTIQARNAELRRTQDWLGLPYDLEWTEVQERLPKLCALYREAVNAALGQEAGQEGAASPGTDAAR